MAPTSSLADNVDLPFLVFAPLSRALVSRMVEGVKGVEVKSIRRNKRSGTVGVVGNGDRSSGEGSGIPVVLLLGGGDVFFSFLMSVAGSGCLRVGLCGTRWIWIGWLCCKMGKRR